MNQANDTNRTGDTAPRLRNRVRARPGYTLVEMMVVMSIVSLLLSSVGVALHSLFRVDQHLRQGVVQAMLLTRVSLTLRGDAHEADSATTDGPSRVVLAYADDRTVAYAYDAEKARLVRLVRQGDKIQHREVYRLPKDAAVSWRTEKVEAKTLVILEVVHQVGAIEGARDGERVHRIEAVVALDADDTNVGP
ncbi:MAG: type II secretion system protein J [Pirellulaceae bacterium]